MIILAGTIGAGKTTLTKKLSKHFNSEAFYEPVGDNPVLPLFYKNPEKYGFLLQIYFLNQRFDMIKRAMQNDNNILDRSIYEDALFTDLNAELGRINPVEAKQYHHLLDNMMEELPYAAHKKRPDLMIYLGISLDNQLNHIENRGRDYEQISNDPELLDYYKLLQSKYHDWYNDYDASPKIKINANKYDFENNPEDLQEVLKMIDDKLEDINKWQGSKED